MLPLLPNPPTPYLPNFMFSPPPFPTLFPKIRQNKNENQTKQKPIKTRQNKTKPTK